MQNVQLFVHYFFVTQMAAAISNFCRFVSLCIWWITLSAYITSDCFVSKKQFCNVPLMVLALSVTEKST